MDILDICMAAWHRSMRQVSHCLFHLQRELQRGYLSCCLCFPNLDARPVQQPVQRSNLNLAIHSPLFDSQCVLLLMLSKKVIQTCNVADGCVGTEAKLFWVVPFVIADWLLIGDDISGVECVVLAIGGMVDGAKPLDSVTKGLDGCDWVCECWCVVWG